MLAGLAVSLLVIALAGRFSGLLPWALVTAGGQYAAFLVIREQQIDAYAPFYGAGLLLVAELAYWSIERGVTPAAGDRIPSRRFTTLLTAVFAAGGIGGVILTMAELSVSGGLGLEVLGVAAAVAALGIVGYLARRPAS